MPATIKSALMRKPGLNITQAISMNTQRQKPDVHCALEEHEQYAKLLRSLGLHVTVLDADPNFPDGLFVEDTYFVVDTHIFELNPGAPSRKLEYQSLKSYLPHTEHYHRIPKDIRIDGGDILLDERWIFVGLTQRTDAKAIPELEKALPNYAIIPVPVRQGLHLKSAITRFAPKKYVVQKHLLAQMQNLADTYRLDISLFTVPDTEAHAANLLYLNEHVIMPNDCPNTKEMLYQHYAKTHVHEIGTEQVRRIDGAISCCSLLFAW